MGGNALFETHGLESKRMNVQQYEHLKENVSKFLDNLDVDYRHVKAYHTKDSFGDLDIVVSRGKMSVTKIRQYLKIGNLPMTNELTMPKNVSGISTLVTGFQIDFIFVEPEELESAVTYYSYNDIWNLLGKVIKTWDYKLGWQGLLYTYRNGTHYKEDIVLTYDLYTALNILGLSVDRYLQGFDTHEDMFEYVISSKAFDPSKFALENLNHRNRVRDRKRQTYNLFLQYIEGKEYPKPQALIRPEDRFPHLVGEIKKRDDMFVDANNAKKIINGNIIRELTGLEDVKIKKVLETFRARFKVEDILVLSGDEVKNIVLDIVREFDL